MTIAGSRVAIVGGSIAGCAAAHALHRAGCDIEIFERSDDEMKDRGAGIAMPTNLLNQLISAAYLPAAYPSLPLNTRWWIHGDGSPAGRTLWQQPGAGVSNNWGILWRALRANIEARDYHTNKVVASYENQPDGVLLRFTDGATERFDALVAADGYRSVVRQQMPWGSQADFSGYVMWRGNYEESRLRDRTYLDRLDAGKAWLTVCFNGGHGLLYMIPDFDDGSSSRSRRVNWGVYTHQPEGFDFSDPTSIPPGGVSESLYAHLDRRLSESFPPEIEALFRLTPREQVSLQPIYDELAVHFTDGRVLLVGDAAAVTRPHTASGATKALQDALVLERLGKECETWESLLEAYDAERLAACNSIVEMGRRIGHAQVESTPDWATMTPTDFDVWTKATLAGEQLYFYGNASNGDD